MWKRIGLDWRAGFSVSLAVSAIAGPATSFAGPGCMSKNQPVARGFSPHSTMGPQAGYGPRTPYACRGASPAYRGMMAAPYIRPMPARWHKPRMLTRLSASAPVEKSPPEPRAYAASSQSMSAGETVTVRIDGMRFEPASITVKPGTTVTWVQGSRIPHTVTGTARELRSDTLRMGQQYSHTFT